MQSLDKITTTEFLETAPLLPPYQAILLAGESGIGKSQLMHQLADILQLPIIDRRLSQMMEGDLLGLPKIHDKVTSFCPPDWVHEICKKPHLLFLDELNRAENHVQQMIFQLILDRRIQDFEIHPQTRICSAMNIGSNYLVNHMDPALVRRFWICELNFSADLWLNWAKTHINQNIYDYLCQNPDEILLKPEGRQIAPFPNPASWHRLSEIISEIPEEILNEVLIKNIGKGLLGQTIVEKLLLSWNLDHTQICDFQRMIMGEVPVNWMQQQSIIGLSNMIPDCVEMLQNAILGDNQLEILANWIQLLPNEGVFYLYKEIMEKMQR